MSLLQMSVAGTVMILAILIIRLFAVNRVPKKTFLILWAVTIIRLLIPFSIPSTFSIYSMLGTQLSTSSTNVPNAGFMPGVSEEQVVDVQQTDVSSVISVSIWNMIWLIGFIVCVVFFIVAYWRCYREFQMSLPVENEITRTWLQDHKLWRRIVIRQSDRISSPLTFGLFRPVILMPKETNWENQNALQYVLEHEYVHIQRFDILSKLVLIVTVCLHWFNPIVWMMYFFANRDLELSCDETVVRRFGRDTRSSYANVLIEFEEKRSRFAPLCNHFSKNALEERITAIMKTRKTTVFSLVIAVAFIIGIVTAFATSGKFESKRSENLSEADYESMDLCAYVRSISGNTLVVDPVEYISSDNKEKILKYNLTEDDMPDGYYLYNEDEATAEYKLTDQTEYSFLDWGRDFGGTDEDIRVVTTDKSVFQKYMQTYTDGKPGMPFFFELDGDKVVKIVEKAMA